MTPISVVLNAQFHINHSNTAGGVFRQAVYISPGPITITITNNTTIWSDNKYRAPLYVSPTIINRPTKAISTEETTSRLESLSSITNPTTSQSEEIKNLLTSLTTIPVVNPIQSTDSSTKLIPNPTRLNTCDKNNNYEFDTLAELTTNIPSQYKYNNQGTRIDIYYLLDTPITGTGEISLTINSDNAPSTYIIDNNYVNTIVTALETRITIESNNNNTMKERDKLITEWCNQLEQHIKTQSDKSKIMAHYETRPNLNLTKYNIEYEIVKLCSHLAHPLEFESYMVFTINHPTHGDLTIAWPTTDSVHIVIPQHPTITLYNDHYLTHSILQNITYVTPVTIKLPIYFPSL